MFWTKKACNEFVSGALTTAPNQGWSSSTCPSTLAEASCPGPRMPSQGTESSNGTSTAQATLRWEDVLAVFPGLSSSDQPSVAHINSNILTFLSCSTCLAMQSLQESFPPKFLMETMKITTRGQSESCPAKTLQHRPGAVRCIPWTLL